MALDDAALVRAARTWSSSAPVDVEFWSALRGVGFASVDEVAEDWVRVGMPARLTPDPFLDFHSLPPEARRAWRRQDVDAVLRHLRAGAPGPLADRRGDQDVRAAMVALAARLARGDSDVPSPPPRSYDDALTSVVVVATGLQPAARAVRRLVQVSGDDVQVVVVDDGTPDHAALGLHARLLRDGVRGLRVAPGAHVDTALEVARSRVRGARVVHLAPHVLVRPGWLVPLLAELERPDVDGAVPLVLDELDLVAGEGALAGRPPEDAEPLDGARVDAPHDVVAVRAGADTQPADGARLVTAARVTTVAPPCTRLPDLPAPTSRAEGSRRWSLRLPSPPGAKGDRWGDTHFAAALARSLRRLGEDVVTRRRGAHDSGSVELDDVNLALRGLHSIQATPGAVNVLWVISHPDDVDPAELEGYDVVCAASVPWSERLSARTGRDVVPLLQASEFEAPTGVDASDPAVVFVGNVDARRDRPMVHRALEAGVPLAVYGAGWHGLPEGVWRGEYVDNALLPQLYRRHGIVLADHWPDMAAEGFVANRVFDAVASGARVVSDEVVGLRDLFDDSVVAVAGTPHELAAAYERLGRAGDDLPEALSVSFDDRAQTLHGLVRSL